MARVYSPYLGRHIEADLPEHKTFNMRQYRLVCFDFDHQGALDEADRRRSMGDLARAVKVQGYWCVYARETS